MNELDETQIAALMKGTQFNGCFTKDDLNYIPEGNTVYNLNGVSHWTAMVKDKNNYYYFDSYGVVPPQLLEDMILCHTTGKDLKNPYANAVERRNAQLDGEQHGFYCYNTKEIQAINSSSCGYYCCAFLKWMDKSKNKFKAFQDFQNLFSDKYLKNEEVLHELLKQP
jgi:hypothetical protein